MSSEDVFISAVGDISLGDFPFCIGYGVGSTVEKNGSGFIFEKIAHLFETSDVVFGNLETVLSSNGLDNNDLKSLEMRGNPQSIVGLKKCNFNVLNIANNHALQHGANAFFETASLLESNEILQVGLNGSNGWHSKHVVLEKKGIKFGFLGYAFETDKYFGDELKYAFGNPEYIKRDISKCRSEVDYVIVSCHWGVEFMDRPSLSTIRLARQMIDWGANVVLGHHPHVLQGVERYRNGVIIYSLGNFVFDMHWDRRFKQSMIVNLVFNKSERIKFEVTPIVINDFYQPEVAVDQNAEQIEQLLNKLSQKISKELEGNTEYNAYKYYLEFESIRKSNRYKSYRYFLNNIRRVGSMSLLCHIIMRTVFRRIDDVICLFKKKR